MMMPGFQGSMVVSVLTLNLEHGTRNLELSSPNSELQTPNFSTLSIRLLRSGNEHFGHAVFVIKHQHLNECIRSIEQAAECRTVSL